LADNISNKTNVDLSLQLGEASFHSHLLF